MNIFATSTSPKESAQFLDDKRVVKMTLESAQMLSTAIHLSDSPNNIKEKLYKATHKNHPCSIWCRENRSNYIWLYNHFIELGNEYAKRYGKIHKSIINLSDILYDSAKYINEGSLTNFANCANNSSIEDCDYRSISNVNEAYRLYLHKRWKYDKIKPKWSGNKNDT